jgi:hypothetical protein
MQKHSEHLISETSIRAKYVVGCDGARSLVRDAIGAVPHGDFANHAWGVVDMLAVTDFPDIRLKAAIQSADEGNILLIPREGGYLVRLYVDLGEIDPNNREAFRLSNTQEKVIETAQRVLRPYTLDVRDVAWFAVYQVGQRVTDRFDAAGAGYSTELMARAVAPGGKVYAQNDKASEKLAARMKTPAMANAVEVVLPFDNLSDPELHDLDLVTFLFGYHDTTFMAPRSAKPCTASPRRRYETRLNARDSRLSQTLISCVIPKTRGPISCSKTRHRTMNSC